MMKPEELPVTKRHKNISYLQHNEGKNQVEETPIPSTPINRITPVNIPLLGLCCNCEQWRDCYWKENHKVFCEHYY
ncbi:hypothetical protein [Flavobacterium sedimenticola]|uniref:Uncharacterized protein n=1 Tax=Flavobacterium sedimenticola TaxID=3043286 RepID=A0ABT6XNS2_9FLAO|nr:hypothetical protein [Flavobacterium sedimenticola]MDI9256738.1 hypothetical protein [Flavobacterium sedimenticola]